VPCFAIAPLGLTTEGSTKFKLKGWKCYLKKLQCIHRSKMHSAELNRYADLFGCIECTSPPSQLVQRPLEPPWMRATFKMRSEKITSLAFTFILTCIFIFGWRSPPKREGGFQLQFCAAALSLQTMQTRCSQRPICPNSCLFFRRCATFSNMRVYA